MDLVAKPLPYSSSSCSWKAIGIVSDQFPAGLRVLVVDDDPTCLRILEKMLRNCLYEVTTCNRAEVALKFLRENKNGYDIVMSDVHMPDMDGFKLLEHVGLEMDLPVIMMSADDSKNVVMKGVTHGACDYLIKPVRMEALKNMWQHVVRKKTKKNRDDFEPSNSAENGENLQKLSPEDLDCSSYPSANGGNLKSSKKRKDGDEEEERDDTSTLKKPRIVWSVELHQQFVNAVNHLGIDKAVPKKILELMNVPGLTRENVASHLQKFRLYLRRLSGGSQYQNGLNNSFMGPKDVNFGQLSSINGIEFQALAAFGRANSKTTFAQRNIFCFENPKLGYVDGGQQQTKQVNLLHGIPTNMDSKQLANLHHSVLSQAISVSPPSGQYGGLEKVCGLPSYGSISGQDFPRTQKNLEFSGINNSFDPTTKLQDEVVRADVKYWSLPYIDSSSNLSPSMLTTQMGFSLSKSNGLSRISSSNRASASVGLVNNPIIDRPINSSSIAENSPRITKAAERLTHMGFENGLFDEHDCQDDLMSAMLKQQETMAPSDREFGLDGYHMDNLAV